MLPPRPQPTEASAGWRTVARPSASAISARAPGASTGAGEPTEAVPAGKLVDRCEEFFAQSESVAELTAWQERNRIPLRDFFARYKSDGLRIKELVEGRSTRLEAMA